MIYCRNCGLKLSNFYKYCPECGIEVKKLDFQNMDFTDLKYDYNKMQVFDVCTLEKYGKSRQRGIGYILISIPLMFILVGFIPFFMGLYLIKNSKDKDISNLFNKQSNRITIGMNIHRVRAMMAFIDPVSEGYINNLNRDYYISYDTNFKHKKNKVYESFILKFNSKGNLIKKERTFIQD